MAHHNLLAIALLWLGGCGPISQDTQTGADKYSSGVSTTQVVYEPAPILFERDGMAPAPGDVVAIRANSSHAGYTQGRPESLSLKVDFVAAMMAATNARPPLNISLVLDRSGSMKEDKKFAYTMEAARWVVANMSPRDTLSIVAFHHEAIVVAAASPVVNKPFLFHRLEELHPEGRTDISAAMLEAIAQIESKSVEGAVQHVLLVTDGNANVGVTEADGLANIAAAAHERGIGFSTVGLGNDFDEKALVQIANAGSGRYTYVSDPESIPSAFKTELGGLLAAVAQNVLLRVIVQGGVIDDVSGQILDGPTKSYDLRIGNLRATERGSLMLQLKPTDFAEGAALRYQVVLSFDDPVTAKRNRRVTAGEIAYQSNGSLIPNETVLVYDGILEALRVVEEAALGKDEAQHDFAKDLMQRWHDRAERHAMATQNQELLNHAFMLKHFLAEMDQLERDGQMHGHDEARQALQKRGNYQRYLLMHHKSDEH